jgi:hypothetical protein
MEQLGSNSLPFEDIQNEVNERLWLRALFKASHDVVQIELTYDGVNAVHQERSEMRAK